MILEIKDKEVDLKLLSHLIFKYGKYDLGVARDLAKQYEKTKRIEVSFDNSTLLENFKKELWK